MARNALAVGAQDLGNNLDVQALCNNLYVLLRPSPGPCNRMLQTSMSMICDSKLKCEFTASHNAFPNLLFGSLYIIGQCIIILLGYIELALAQFRRCTLVPFAWLGQVLRRRAHQASDRNV